MKHLIFILLTFAIANFVKGQELMDYQLRDLQYDVEMLNSKKSNNIDGSPYFKEGFTQSTFYTKDGKKIDVNARLNLYAGVFEFVKNDIIIAINNQSLDSVIYEGSTYVSRKVNLISDKIQLLKIAASTPSSKIYEYNRTIFKDEVTTNGFNEAKPARYSPQESIIVLEFKGEITELVPFSKLYKAYPDQASELKKFIKKNKIKRNSANGMQQLLELMEEIVI